MTGQAVHPAKNVKQDRDDLAGPTTEPLRQLGLLEPETPPSAGPLETPYSLELIKSGAMSLSK